MNLLILDTFMIHILLIQILGICYSICFSFLVTSNSLFPSAVPKSITCKTFTLIQLRY